MTRNKLLSCLCWAALCLSTATAGQAFFLPAANYPLVSAKLPDSSDDSPSAFTDEPLLELSLAHVIFRHPDSRSVRANDTFWARRYDIEPETYSAPHKSNRYFPFQLSAWGVYGDWLWGADYKLAAVNVFKFTEAYFYSNDDAQTMDTTYLTLKNDLHFYRLRFKAGRRIAPHLTMSLAPFIYHGSYVLDADKQYRFEGQSDYYESYRSELSADLSGATAGLQAGALYTRNLIRISSYVEYSLDLTFSGRVSTETDSFREKLRVRLPVKFCTVTDYEFVPDNVVQLTLELNFWGGEIYSRVPEFLEAEVPSETLTGAAGLGWMFNFTDRLLLAAGYQYLMLPEDGPHGKFFELSGDRHRLSGRASYRRDSLIFHTGASLFLGADKDSLPAALSISFAVAYYL